MKLSALLILSTICFLLASCQTTSTPKAASAEQLLRKEYVSTLDNETHQYFVYLPRGYGDQPAKKWPVILFLHGNGERGNGRDELDYVIAHGPLYEVWIQKRDLPFIIISPQLPMLGMEKVPYIANRTPAQIPLRLAQGVPERAALFSVEGPMEAAPVVSQADMKSIPPLLPNGWEVVEQDLLNMLGSVQKTYAADAARIYLTGLSYGGFGTWLMANKHPDIFAAIAPVVGWGHPDLMAPIAQHQLPVWAFAGGRDKSVNKKFFYPGLSKLEELGNKEVRFTVEEDMAHDAWKRIYSGDDLYQWLLAHRKN